MISTMNISILSLNSELFKFMVEKLMVLELISESLDLKSWGLK
jgi:hypothetical protein